MQTDKPARTNGADPDQAPRSHKAKGEKEQRVSFVIGDDGRPIVGKLRSDSRDKLIAILKDGELARELGLNQDDTATGNLIPAHLVQGLIVGLGQLECVILGKLTKAPRAIIDQIVPYTPAEVAQIEPAATAVLNKYGGPALSKYGDEAALAVVLVTLTTKKLEAIGNAMHAIATPIEPADRIELADVPAGKPWDTN